MHWIKINPYLINFSSINDIKIDFENDSLRLIFCLTHATEHFNHLHHLYPLQFPSVEIASEFCEKLRDEFRGLISIQSPPLVLDLDSFMNPYLEYFTPRSLNKFASHAN